MARTTRPSLLRTSVIGLSLSTAPFAYALPQVAEPIPPPPRPEGMQENNSPQELSPEASADDIFLKVFGKSRPTIAAGEYPVQIENIFVGEFLIRPMDNDNGTISSKFIEKALAPILLPEHRDSLKALVQGKTELHFQELRDWGLGVKFDAADLVLKISVPADRRNVSEIYIRSLRRQADLEYVPQSEYSAFLSFRAGLTYIEDSATSPTGFYRKAADIDVAVNVHGIVAEAEFRYDDRNRRPLRRGDVRLTYDDRSSMIRYEVGDLTVGRRPFQLAPRMAGVGVFRKYSINPYYNIRPTAEQEFLLERPARVEVLINGVPSRTFTLSSGRYKLRDFPLVSSAANDIELIIRYDSGETERLSFPAFYDIDLLNPGLLDFAVNVGVPFRDEGGIRRYDTSRYNSTGYLRYGVNSAFTAGMNWEGNNDFFNLGTEVLWATSLGTFALNTTADVRNLSPESARVSLQYRWRETDPTRDLYIDGMVTLSGKEYRSLNLALGDDLLAAQARLRAGMRISDRSRIQTYGSWDRYRGRGTSYSAGVSYSHQLKFGSFSGSVEYRRAFNESGPGFNLGLIIPLGRSSLTASFDSYDNNARLYYSRSGHSGIGSISTNFGIERRDGSDRQSGRIAYHDNRFETSFEQIARNYFTDNNRRDLRSEFTFGSALVMADGHLAISRPVTNSFAIFDKDDAAGKYQIMVEPRVRFGASKVDYSARSGTLGPAVVSTLSPYLNRAIQVDAPEAPAGSSLGGQIYLLSPGYRSGYHIKIGNSNNVSIVGNLTDIDGDPVAYLSGEVVSVSKDDDAATSPPQFFTNATGRFFVEGVKAGKSYSLRLEVNGVQTSVNVDVPDTSEGIYRLEAPLKLPIDINTKESGDE